MWLTQLLKDLAVKKLGTSLTKYDNQVVLSIFASLIHHEETRNIDIDYHFIRDKVVAGITQPTYAPSHV